MLRVIITLLLLSQGNSGAATRRRREDQCPKLEFLTSSYGCQPCSLCNPTEPNFNPQFIRESCRNKHLDLVIPNKGTQRLWCDDLNGPFPECPPIPEAALRNCTQKCTDRGRRFAPGCQCQVGCPGEPNPSSVECTRDLHWRSSNGSSSSINIDQPVSPCSKAEDEAIPWHWVLLAGFFAICFGACFVVGAVLLRRRRQKRSQCPLEKNDNNNSSSTFSSSTKSDKSCKSDELAQDSKTLGSATISVTEGSAHSNEQAVSQHSVHQVSGNCAVPVAAETPASVVNMEAPAPETVPLLGSGTEGAEERRVYSLQALKALLRDYEAMKQVTKLFDQEEKYDKITWHVLATEHAGWDPNEVRSQEYRLRPCVEGGPGDCFTYQVLLHTFQSGKGLLELLHFLKNRPHYKHPEAERFLWNFWETWKKGNLPENKVPC
ncbi:uncharacterized protein LOC143298507 isoform X1 [Babylonia areolata]|uniref:uncharacterized protein LOC143298507 isoform X1 n=1 Tax=Babylonia areolata TaxID=304850 RepID=UPI003FD23B98